MQQCAYCNRTILFGGRRHGESRFCNNSCLLNGLLSIHGRGEQDAPSGFREAILSLHHDLEALATDVQNQRMALAEALERLDFVERALVQLRDAKAAPPTLRE